MTASITLRVEIVLLLQIISTCPPPSHSRHASLGYSLLWLLALGGFASPKTILNRFRLVTHYDRFDIPACTSLLYNIPRRLSSVFCEIIILCPSRTLHCISERICPVLQNARLLFSKILPCSNCMWTRDGQVSRLNERIQDSCRRKNRSQ